MPRQRNQVARRAELLDAAVRVINDRGPAGIQMKDVARAANMATGSIYYYYDNVDELMQQVHALAFERYNTGRIAAIAELEDPRHKLVTMIELGLPKPEDEPLLLALLQIGVAKARDPHHIELITDLCGEQRLLYQELLEAGTEAGVFKPTLPIRDIAEHLVALEDGYGLTICTGRPEQYTYQYARDLMIRAAAGWTGCADLERFVRDA